MEMLFYPSKGLHGVVTPPPDKAICHRLVLLAALADGVTDIAPWPAAEDCRRTLELVQRLGVAVERTGFGVQIRGRPQGFAPADAALDCGASGTTLRLAAGVLAGQPFRSVLAADDSLSARPMRRIVEPLTAMGVQIQGRADPASGDIHPPLTIHGRRPLRAIRYELPVASAQVKSAILLAALAADGPTTVVERTATRDHTERALRRFGADVRQDGLEIVLFPGRLRAPGACAVPGDPSSAAFFVVAAACVPGSSLEVRGVGCNPSRLGFVRVLARMGAQITVEVPDNGWEPLGTLRVAAAPLRATSVEADEVAALIDELPVLMVAAAAARGTSTFRGVRELRVKETDRVRSMVQGLQAFGAQVRLLGEDGVAITGGALHRGDVEGAGDHRTVMSLAVAALLAGDGPSVVRGAEAVAKSYPEFFDHLQAVAGPSASGGGPA